MSEIHGHFSIVHSFNRMLWPVSIFVGPPSVGKWTVAEKVRRMYKFAPADVLRLHRLTAEDVETVRQFLSTPAVDSLSKLIIVEVDKAPLSVQAALGKVMEFFPGSTYIVIGQNPSSALTARGAVFKFGYLTDGQVAEILVEQKRLDPEHAKEIAAQSGGMVWPAFKLIDQDQDLPKSVIAAVRAITSRDADALEELAKNWNDEATDLLVTWCGEAITGRWKTFGAETAVQGKSLPLSILLALEPEVRPRLVIRSQLMSILKGA